MLQIVPHQNDFDLFAKLIVMDQGIRRIEIDGVIYFAIVDVIELLSDAKRKDAPRKFWNDFKQSRRMKDLSGKFRQLKVPSKKDGKGYKTDCGDYAFILYISMSMPDEKANMIRAYVAERVARMSEPAFKYLIRQQSESKALAAEEIRHLHEIKYLPTYKDDDAFSDLGYHR